MMRLPLASRLFPLIAVAAVVSCGGGESLKPSNEPPAKIDAISDLIRSGTVGSTVTTGLVVKVTDASGRPVQGASVAFAVTLGNGTTNPRVAVTDANGQAVSTWTLGTIVGPNEVTASVDGVATSLKFQATGLAGAVSAVSLSTQNARLLSNVDTIRISAQALDFFGNATSPAPTFTVRNPSVVTVDASGLIRAVTRGSSTYVIATAGTKSDSVLVTVLAPGQSICTAVASPVELAVGQVLDVSGSGFCIKSTTAGAEYALVPFYNAAVPSASTSIEVRPQGIAPLGLTSLADFTRAASYRAPTELVPDYAAESRRRDQERREGALRMPALRASLEGARRNVVAGAAQTVPAIGDILKLNTNAFDFCDNPDFRTGRVVAVTDKAIIVADTANPAGGFSSDEYRSIGVTFDTLINPLDTTTFGSPSDIDNNGRVIMFFTRAVNELTAAGSGSVYLGLFYLRDLYQKASQAGTCAGSNVGEMFYLLVPDTGGVVNGNKRPKSQVLNFTLGTVAHEYQHLINASRRLYVNNAPVFEEKWLDEGLAHIAEDLTFWRASGIAERSNVDTKTITDPRVNLAYQAYGNFNRSRYVQYLGRTETQAPIGFDALDDDLFTRGAIWSFLRYSADRMGAGPEPAFWRNLANSKTSGVANLTAALGTNPATWLRDWALSVYLDDLGPAVDARYKQLSWNIRDIVSGGGLPYPLITRLLSDNTPLPITMAANGVSFVRFSVANGQEALLTVTSGGLPLPSTVQLAVVRVR
jgi:hypothetical protein